MSGSSRVLNRSIGKKRWDTCRNTHAFIPWRRGVNGEKSNENGRGKDFKKGSSCIKTLLITRSRGCVAQRRGIRGIDKTG